MIKILSTLVVCCSAVWAAPAPAPQVQADGQIRLRSIQQLDSPYWNNIQAVRTQQVLPVQELAQGEVLNLPRADQEQVLFHFRTHGSPVQIATSHVPSPPGQVSHSKVQDEPHRVIHEVHRPIIQEIREIIQPYRRVTQEILPVQEQVHTSVASGTPNAAPVAVSAPAQAVVAAPVQTVVRAEAPALVSAQTPSVIGAQYNNNYPVPFRQALTVERGADWGVISSPPSLYTPGSYIQAYLEQLRGFTGQAQLQQQQQQQQVVLEQPQVAVAAPVVEQVAVEQPVAQVADARNVVVNNGGYRLTQKYREY